MAVSTIDPAGLNIGQIGGRRNIIQNGSFAIAQRTTSASISSGTVTYAADRWYAYFANTDQLTGTLSQDTDAPEGFGYSAKITTGTQETTVDANEYVTYTQKMEGYNLQSLAYGTSGAKQTVLSFWVKSSVTGTFAINMYQSDGAYLIGSTYAINSANTWEYKQIVISGNTLGSIANDNTEGLRVTFFLAAGSQWTSTDNTSWGSYADGRWAYGHAQNGVVTTAGATWQITGIQLEVGDTATSFEHESYGTTLQKCQRYFDRKTGTVVVLAIAQATASDTARFPLQLLQTMRAAPTLSVSNVSDFRIRNATGASKTFTTMTLLAAGNQNVDIEIGGASTLVAGDAAQFRSNTTTATLDLDAEL